MPDTIEQRSDVPVLVCDPAGPPVSTVHEALDLVGAVFAGAEVAAVPASRLAADFFNLSTGFAGEVTQKFVTYQMRLVIVGDIRAELAASPALRAFVHESNRAKHVWFVPDLETLDAWLAERT